MKMGEGFFLRSIGDEAIAVPVGQNAVDFGCLISLNSTGRFLCELMREEITEDDLVSALTGRFDIGPEQALQDVSAYIAELRRVGVIE